MDCCFAHGNDCAVAIAEHVGGSVEGFAELMNNKATELGLVNTHFVTPHGLDDDNHYTTAYDLAVLTNYALNIEKFRNIVGTKTTSIMVGNYSRTITNTNELLGYVDGVYGVKTGFTGNAGRCLVTSCKRGNLDIIIVVLGADTKKIRGLDTRNVINYVFNNFEMVDTYEKIEFAFENFKNTQKISVNKSLGTPEIGYLDNYTYIYPINKNEISDLKTSIYTVTKIDAETPVGSKLGVMSLKHNDKILYSVDIVLKNNLNRTTWQDYFIIFLSNYKNYFKLNV